MPRLTSLQEDRIRQVATRVLALQRERDGRVEARARCELLSEQATTALATARQAYDAAVATAKEAAAAVVPARRAVGDSDGQIADCYAAISAIEEGRTV